ncbi:hypothetical protein CSC02_4535 [Enterobacter hormaechei subsp. hoffmannii]|nr:hypothetical protein CSC02_4535 [Enterobacter hormaechei subsp. hoffmannii]
MLALICGEPSAHRERENLISQFLRFNFSFLDTYPDNYYRDRV